MRNDVATLKSAVSLPHGSGHQGAYCFVGRQDSIHKGDEFRNGNQGSEREKGTKVYGQLVFRASKIKYYSSRKDMKWRKGKFKFIHLFRKYLLRTCSLPGTVLGP